MAIFSGKIIEAYYTNTDNDSVEVIYEEGKRAINHYLPMDMGHPDVKALLKEYPLAKIADTTVARNKEAIKQLNRVVEAKVKQKIEDKPMQNFDSVMDFIINYDSKKQADIVKDFSDNDIKTKIRQAKTPLDVLLAYRDIVVKNR